MKKLVLNFTAIALIIFTFWSCSNQQAKEETNGFLNLLRKPANGWWKGEAIVLSLIEVVFGNGIRG